jgi:lipopolysaccharide/colanic/teichoic acid biosynthesis glycosyltransferase
MLLDLGEASGRREFDRERDELLPSLGGATPEKAWYPTSKAAVEFVAAFCLLILTAPLILLAALLAKLSSSGPALYCQIRLGWGGVPYTIYKIRTMTHQCEKWSGPQWSRAGDPRVTRIGHFLRATHLDELPQLWNVLRGEMSLVGPRPERPEFVPHLERVIPHYRERLRIRPGVTGLAQVQLPADTDVKSVRRKLAYDLYYVRHMGPWLDVRITVCTVLKVLGVPFPILRTLLRMPSNSAVKLASKNLRVRPKSTLQPNKPNNALP